MRMTGSCLCGDVAYVATDGFDMSGNCHCNICKKITGGAFEAFAIIDQDRLKLVQGEQELVEYRISGKAKKYFCGTCGTPVYNRYRPIPGKLVVHIGTLDDPASVTPTFNLYCENMLPWVAELSSLKNFAQGFNR